MILRSRFAMALGLLSVLVAGPLCAAPPSDQQVRQLLDAIGLGRSLAQTNTAVAASMSRSLPCVSIDYWKTFLDANAANDYISRLVPIYQKHFTADEVDQLIKFYSSPLGQKELTEMPVALAEASQAGQQWSHQRGQQMLQKLEQNGQVTAGGRCPGIAPAPPVAAASSAAPGTPGAVTTIDANAATAAVAGAAAASAQHADEDAGEDEPASAASSSHVTHSRTHHHETRAERLRREREERERKASSSRHPTHETATQRTEHAASDAKTKAPVTKKKATTTHHKAAPAKKAPASSSSSG